MNEGIRRRRAAVDGVELDLLEAGDPGAPVVLLSHGFPESAHSWRHQLLPLAAAGYHVLAPDQRGYAGSTAPKDVDAYRIDHLCADLVGLLDQTGQEQMILVGHDWGALLAWDFARLHPERLRALVAVSVPLPAWSSPPVEAMQARFGDRFFYIVYFQDVGVAEAELDADPRRTMAKVLWSASGDAPTRDALTPPAPRSGTGFLTNMADPPDPLPSWLSAEDLDTYTEQFGRSGFFGPVSWYRNMDANFRLLEALPYDRIAMPVGFIAGDRDPVIAMNPRGVDRMRGLLPDLRQVTMIPGAGHWTQQERPDAFNAALLGFLASV